MDKFKLIQVMVWALLPLSGIAQKVEIYEETGGAKYAAINTDGMPRNIEDRKTISDFYIDAYLYDTSGSPITDGSGNTMVVKRVKRHCTGDNKHTSSIDYNISTRFIVSPTIVNSDGTTAGTTGSKTMNWATANGYSKAANANAYTTPEPTAIPAGCSKYKGKSGTDTEGTWRVPTHKEGALIAIFYKDIEKTIDQTGFTSFAVDSQGNSATIYWLATEDADYSNKNAWGMEFYKEAKATPYQLGTKSKTSTYFLRCIRDI